MNKPVRRRRAPTELRISQNSKAAMQAHLQSEEGQRCLDEFASVIAKWAAKYMPIQLLQGLGTPEGQRVFQDLWPDMVDAFFKAHSSISRSNNPHRLSPQR